MNKIDFTSRAEVEVSEKIISGSGSPTSTFKNDVALAVYNGTGLSKLDKIVLVDSAGAERDYSTSLTFSTSVDTITVNCTISITASYSIAKVRVYSGTKLYFETALSTAVSVNAGDTVAVTWSMTVNMSGTLSGYSFVIDAFRSKLINVLTGSETASALNVTSIRIWVYNVSTATETYYDQTPSKSISNNVVTMSTSLTLNYDFEVRDIEINAGSSRLWYWAVSTPPKGTAGSTISYTETDTF
jgi:hypothetical protein